MSVVHRTEWRVRRWWLLLVVLLVWCVSAALGTPSALAATRCQTSSPPAGGYTVNLCFDQPLDGASLTGAATVSASVTITGSSRGVQKLVFYIDGQYLLTDYESPYTFTLPSTRWADGTHTLEVEASMRDGFISPRSGATVSFANGISNPPPNNNQFTPTSGTTPLGGQPFVLGAVGDGAGGETSATGVVNVINSWNPNLFVYLGDVYEKGSYTEFQNWYGGASTYYGQLRSRTNPVVGNHEYSAPPNDASGYFNYWDNIPHYYSYNANGWHFIALDSTSQFGQQAAGSAQYQWLANDLALNASARCTVAYWHHPLYNIGEEGSATRMDEIWRLLYQNGVDIVLNGHDHTYQRWTPLNSSGTPSSDGMTEFVAGTGGHSQQTFVNSDSRVSAAFTGFGALRLELNSDGAAYKYVTSSGQRLDSGSVQCRGTTQDISPPTTPLTLTASAQSRSQVNLNWATANDNVGVTGYDIYRNGSLLKSIGPDTSYSDTAVTPETTYSYTVKAHDAAGNASPASNTATTTTPALGVLFDDGFESGNFSQWTSTTGGMTVVSSPVFSGSKAARALSTTNSSTASTYKSLSPTQPNLYYQTRFRVASHGSNTVNLMRFKNSSGTNIASVYLSSTNKLGYRNDVSGVSNTSTTNVSLGAWHTLQTHASINGTSGQIEVWLDGVQITSLSRTESLGTTNIGRIELGDSTKQHTYDMAFDEVAADPLPIADTSAPTIPTGLAATTPTGLEADLSWNASTDDVAVAGYDVYRNGVIIGTANGTTTTYADKTVAPESSYYYEVRARDGAGNASARSDLVTVNTPAAFDDGFESGNLSKWDSGSVGVTVGSAEKFTGSFGARATSTGTAADVDKTLPSAQSELYYRVRFKVLSRGANPVGLMRFRTSTGAALMTLSVAADGTLSARNDVSGVTTTSATAVSSGTWHELQARLLVQGATGSTDVWFDGSPISQFTRTDNFGTAGIGRLEFGDASTGRSFDLAFDDARADGSFIPDASPPTPPTGVSATAVSGSRVDLSWTAGTDNIGVTGYDVIRNGTVITSIGPLTSYSDTTVSPGTTYNYELRALDKAGNSSDASNTATATTPGLDTTPPTKPGALTANAISGTQVDLSWTASTDNVGVTGYTIYRNGSAVTTVSGSTLSYSDRGVAQSNTYTYDVAATDAAGNLSPHSDAASVTTPHAALFSDGYETGDLSNWTPNVVGNVTVQQAQVASGAWAARAQSTGAASWAWRQLPSDQSDITYRVRFKTLAAWTGTVNLLKLRSGTGGAIATVLISSNGTLAVRNEVAGATTTSGTLVSSGVWHDVQIHLTVAGASGQVETLLDSVPISALTKTDNYGTTPLRRVQIGDNSAGHTFDVYFDDVLVDTPTASTSPVNTALPTVSGSAVDGQTLTTTNGTWTSATGISYAYQWRRCDSAGANCAAITGATNSTYRLVSADVGSTVVSSVTATNSAGSSTASSAATGIVAAAAPSNLTPPSITGTAQDGQTLTAANGTWGGTTPLSFAYQWRRCNAAGANCADITGATAQTYVVTSADIASTVRVTVTATNGAGSAAATSAASGQISGVPPANSTAPTITGTTQDGQTLTASPGIWSGSTPISYAYQWRRCNTDGSSCVDVTGATAQAYTLAGADVGKALVVRVTATNTAGSASAASAVSSPVTGVAPSNTAAPSISGLPVDGQTLTATSGTWTGTVPITYGYQWRACDAVTSVCNDIPGATGSTYTLVSAQVGQRILVVVTATNGTGSASAASTQTAAVAGVPPANSSSPTITGTTQDGQTLTASPGAWSGSVPISYAYQWRRCDSAGANCADIAGAATQSYTLTPADTGARVVVAVTATNTAGSASAASAPTAQVGAAAPANTSAPTISGSPVDGQTLTAASGSWTGTPPISYGYQWRRCDSTGANCADIASATGQTYTVAPADVGSTLRVTVTATGPGGSAQASSAATTTVAGVAPSNTSAPTISGTLRDGHQLSADPGNWSGTPTISYGYQWRRCNTQSCTDIAGATSQSYTLAAADIGATLLVHVTATGPGGSASADSAQTGAIAGEPPSNSSAPTISGTAAAGQTLTAAAGTWSGSTPVTYSYQWRQCQPGTQFCSDILTATGSSYVVTGADVGSTLRVRVTGANGYGSSTADSAETATVTPAPIAPANTTAPSISGTLSDGSTLTADAGSWSGTQPISYAYQWRRCDTQGTNCADIGGATGSTYTLGAADVNATVVVAVTATNVAGSATASSSATGLVAANAPTNASPPTVTGNAQSGSTLTAHSGNWNGTTPISYAYQWRRCDPSTSSCADISGATGGTFDLTAADVGSTLHVDVTASNVAGSATLSSTDTGVVAPAASSPQNTTAPSISGNVQDGATLTADRGTWTGTDPISYAYQWRRCAADGTGCTDIAGATAGTYGVAPGDIGSTLRVQVTASNAAGSATASSDPSAQVTAAAPANTAAPSISGTALEGQALSADRGTWSGTGPLSYTYQWRRCNSGGSGCNDVAGATGQTYTLSTADSGRNLDVLVTATSPGGSASARSAAVSVRTPVFSDGFESGTLAGWANFGLTTQQTNVFAGAWGARAQSTGSAAYATHDIAPQTTVSYRVRFRSDTAWPTTGVYLLKLRTATGVSIVGLYVSNTGKLAYRNDIAAAATVSTTSVTTGVWHEARVRLSAGSPGQIDVWLDGTPVSGLSKSENFGTAAIGRIQLGDNSTGRTFDVYSDEVVVDSG